MQAVVSSDTSLRTIFVDRADCSSCFVDKCPDNTKALTNQVYTNCVDKVKWVMLMRASKNKTIPVKSFYFCALPYKNSSLSGSFILLNAAQRLMFGVLENLEFLKIFVPRRSVSLQDFPVLKHVEIEVQLLDKSHVPQGLISNETITRCRKMIIEYLSKHPLSDSQQFFFELDSKKYKLLIQSEELKRDPLACGIIQGQTKVTFFYDDRTVSSEAHAVLGEEFFNATRATLTCAKFTSPDEAARFPCLLPINTRLPSFICVEGKRASFVFKAQPGPIELGNRICINGVARAALKIKENDPVRVCGIAKESILALTKVHAHVSCKQDPSEYLEAPFLVKLVQATLANNICNPRQLFTVQIGSEILYVEILALQASDDKTPFGFANDKTALSFTFDRLLQKRVRGLAQIPPTPLPIIDNSSIIATVETGSRIHEFRGLIYTATNPFDKQNRIQVQFDNISNPEIWFQGLHISNYVSHDVSGEVNEVHYRDNLAPRDFIEIPVSTLDPRVEIVKVESHSTGQSLIDPLYCLVKPLYSEVNPSVKIAERFMSKLHIREGDHVKITPLIDVTLDTLPSVTEITVWLETHGHHDVKSSIAKALENQLIFPGFPFVFFDGPLPRKAEVVAIDKNSQVPCGLVRDIESLRISFEKL